MRKKKKAIKSHTLTVRVDDKTYERITQKCFLLEIKPSDYLRRLVKKDMRKDDEREVK